MKSAFVVVFVFLIVGVYANNYNVTTLRNSDGLSNSSVNRIFQDSYGLIWFGTWDGLNQYNGKDFRCFKPEPRNSYSISNNIIRDILEANRPFVWVATDRGINCYDRVSGRFKRFFSETNVPQVYRENTYHIAANSNKQVFAYVSDQGLYWYDGSVSDFQRIGDLKFQARKIFFDRNDHLWIHTVDKKLYQVVFRNQNSTPPVLERVVENLQLSDIESVFYAAPNQLFLQTADGRFFSFDIAKGSTIEYTSRDNIHPIITSVLVVDNYQLWGTPNGLYIYHIPEKKVELLIPNVSVLSLYQGSQNIVWVGTDTQGVIQLSPSSPKFKAYTDQNVGGFGRSAVRAFFRDQADNLWIGTKGNGIYVLAGIESGVEPKVVKQLKAGDGLSSNSIFTLCPGSGTDLWIGSDGTEINYIDTRSMKVQALSTTNQSNITIKSVYAIHAESDSILWVGTSGNGMYKLTIDRTVSPYTVKSFRHYFFNRDLPGSISNNIVYSIIRADKNALWVGTRGGGLNYFDTKKEKFTPFRFSGENPDLSGCDDILSLLVDRNDILWAGTSMGLVKLINYQDEKPVFQRFTEVDGLPNNTVHGILEDTGQNLWISTNKGLAKLVNSANEARFIAYFEKDGLQNDEFSDGAYYKSSAGANFYFGGINGFNEFDPLAITHTNYMPDLILDGFFVDNKPSELADFMDKSENSMHLQLSHKVKSFSFRFIPVDFISGSKCEIAYKLDGFQQDWIHLGTSNTIVFSNLPKGKYLLKVRCSNADKLWSDKEYRLAFTIRPPWWGTNLAFVVYFILLGMVLAAVRTTIKQQLQAKRAIRAKEQEKLNAEEIHQAKLRFFTNIAHEFSNSLMLIYGPCVQLLKAHNIDSSSRKYVNTIKSNSERMQNLIQELIEFRKAETGFLKPKYRKTDVVELAKYVADNFSEMLEQKHIQLKINFSPGDIEWVTDRDYLEKILFNLLSNAVKYTPERKSVELNLSVTDRVLKISVRNFGVGIKAEKLETIFDRYEVLERMEKQALQGLETRNGIGLALCKSLTGVLGGDICAESDGTTFTHFLVSVPSVDVDATVLNETPFESAAPKINNAGLFAADAAATADDREPQKQGAILVVDDEPEIRRLIVDFLGNTYDIMEAGSGKEAIELIKKQLPVLIISDVIMPEMNGVEFVRIMKNQELTRHIPVILLSTKSNIESQIEGLEVGADAYIGKPFHPRHLQALINRLIHMKQTVIAYSDSPYASMSHFEGKLMNSDDKEFIVKVSKIVTDHIDDESLSIEFIAGEIAVSKIQIYRRLKELVDQTPVEFIRNLRLNHAAKLLKKTNKTVQEIMYESGFNNKTYFYREFAKRFNKTPKEYRDDLKGH